MSAEPKVIELQSQYGKFEIVLNNPHAKRLTIIMLGDRKKGFIPPPRMFDEFRDKLNAAMAEPGDRVILSHPFVSALQIDLPEGPIVVTSPASREGDVPMEVVHPRESETYQVGRDDGCVVVSTDGQKKVWLSDAMIGWLAHDLEQRTPWTYLIEGKRVPVEGLVRVAHAADGLERLLVVDPRRVPTDSPFHHGMLATDLYRKALEEGLTFVLDSSRVRGGA